MPLLPLTLAIGDYDHIRDLASGRVAAEGIELSCLSLPVEEIFFRFIRFREWDVSELSMGRYVSLLSQGDTSFVAIPVFPSRMFRHSAIYIRRDGPIRAPRDLIGRRVGVPEWAQTAGIYVRGLLQHEFGLDLSTIEWVQAGIHEAGREEEVTVAPPSGIRLTRRTDRTLDEMLLTGEIDAVVSAHPPPAIEMGDPRVMRLFEDPIAVEAAYWRKTGIFPIMHTIAMRREVFERHPWVAMNLLKAFETAKRHSVLRALEATASRFPVPWIAEHARRARQEFGEDYWPYGVAANSATLDAFLRYAAEQGVCRRLLTVDELFPREVRAHFKI